MDSTSSKAVLFHKSDFFCALIAGGIALLTYVLTAAPNVTLLDSGEFLVAAQHFGVPHPTGYPLWTLLSWLFALVFPFGNAAWEIAILSGIFAALAVGLSAMLLQSTLRWLFAESPIFQHPAIAMSISVGCSLLLTFSQSMWSQAVIAEVYALHAFLVVSFLICQYAWIRNPASTRLLLASFFLLSLTFSNHQLAVSLAPLPLLGVLLLRRDLIWDLVLAGMLTVLLIYLGFAILSAEPAVLKTSIRFFYFVIAAFAILLVLRRFQIEWNLIAYLPFVIVAGLLPYLYLPFASSTNPPMNWGYTRSPEGFYYSFNRSQYSGSLSYQSLRSLGKLMGVKNPDEPPALKTSSDALRAKPMGRLEKTQRWCGFFWMQLMRSFTPLSFIAFIVAILVILRAELRQRVWTYFLILAFVLAAFLQPSLDGADIDEGSWWLQMPYHTYTNLIYSLIIGIGFAWMLNWLAVKRPRLIWSGLAIPLLAIWPFYVNEAICSQRGHWFGWDFGYDMLKDLPKNAVVFGGTDPGRFVPTYMILGESTQPAKFKRDPNFDRRDLYIITQNGLADPFYLRYIRDHYAFDRPEATTDFEKFLGRQDAYPKETLILPTVAQQKEIIKDLLNHPEKATELSSDLGTAVNAAVARWIFDHNKNKHSFFVEESFPMKWTYAYAVPNGLSYRLANTPDEPLTPKIVKEDFDFWNAYCKKLLEDPLFQADYDAQRSFAKLRNTTGNIYRARKMEKQAIAAYRQSLALWPGCIEALMSLNSILWENEQFEEVKDMIFAAIQSDPNNLLLYKLLGIAGLREELQGKIQIAKDKVAQSPKDADALLELIALREEAQEIETTGKLMQDATNRFPDNLKVMQAATMWFARQEDKERALNSSARQTELEPQNHTNWLVRAQVQSHFDDKAGALESLEKAIQVGGTKARIESQSIPELKKLKQPSVKQTNAADDSK